MLWISLTSQIEKRNHECEIKKSSSITNHNIKIADAVEWEANNQDDFLWFLVSFNTVYPLPLNFNVIQYCIKVVNNWIQLMEWVKLQYVLNNVN